MSSASNASRTACTLGQRVPNCSRFSASQPRLIWEIRRRVRPGSCEIQDEWARDDTHLDDAQLVIETNELRNIESQNLTHARVPQPFVHLALAEIRLDGTMHFEGRFTGCGLAFGHEDDTVNSEAQPLGELKLM